jgi:kynurenine formamidase
MSLAEPLMSSEAPPVGKVIDISLELDPNTFKMHVLEGFQGDAQFEVEVVKPYDGGLGQIVRAVRMRLHAGSHVDAPAHMLRDGQQIHELAIERFVGDALVVDFTDKVPGRHITPDDLQERIGSKVRPGDRLLIRTNVNKNYLGADIAEWKKRSPALTVDARLWCVEKGISLVGFDCYHGAKVPGENRSSSHVLPKAGVLTLPYLNHLDRISKERVTLICLPLNMINVEASPVRAVVLEN